MNKKNPAAMHRVHSPVEVQGSPQPSICTFVVPFSAWRCNAHCKVTPDVGIEVAFALYLLWMTVPPTCSQSNAKVQAAEWDEG